MRTPLVRRENRGPDTCPGPRQRELQTLPLLLWSERRLQSRQAQQKRKFSSWLPPLDRRENSQDRDAFRGSFLEFVSSTSDALGGRLSGEASCPLPRAQRSGSVPCPKP